MSFDFDGMLHKIKDRQWALVDIDWDAPGAETISPELHAKLKPFMSDLMWIENVGAVASLRWLSRRRLKLSETSIGISTPRNRSTPTPNSR